MRTQLSKQTQREQDIYDIFQVIGHVNNDSHTVNVNWNSEEYSVKSYGLSLTEYVWEFHNNALWDTHEHALLELHVIK